MSMVSRVAAVVVIGALFVAPGAALARSSAAKPTTTRTLSGTVVSVSTASNSFVLRRSATSRVPIQVTSATKFVRVSGLSALRTGVRVVVRARHTGTRWTALSVTLR